ncbi:MAG: DUF763 domain-containing protein [Candidatus Lokiarchaeota archaeon]|nr:DUF763 domain-containing protein [Candidatus Lokiarchaeota archaeon]
MNRSGITDLHLHPGKAPQWLLKRMKPMCKQILHVIHDEYGADEILERLSNPLFFQCLSNVLGFDWDSSGVTVVLCGVLKSVFSEDLEILGAGGKGKRSRETISDIERIAEKLDFSEEDVKELQENSRMVAKIDNTAIQDGYNLYHHCMFISNSKKWIVIQQGMNNQNSMSRRYHWISTNLKDFLNDPPEKIIGTKKSRVLNLASSKSQNNRSTTIDLIKDGPKRIQRMFEHFNSYSNTSLINFFDESDPMGKKAVLYHKLFPRRMNWDALEHLYNFQPENYESILKTPGIGPATVRGLSLISDIIYGESPSWKDPVKFSYAYGGKDGVPFPVDRKAYDKSISLLKNAVRNAKLGNKEELNSIRRLKKFSEKIGFN